MAIARKIEAEPRMSRLLDELEPGGEAMITREGQEVGRVVRVATKSHDPASADVAMRKLLQMRARLSLGPFDVEEFKRMRDEGRG